MTAIIEWHRVNLGPQFYRRDHRGRFLRLAQGERRALVPLMVSADSIEHPRQSRDLSNHLRVIRGEFDAPVS